MDDEERRNLTRRRQLKFDICQYFARGLFLFSHLFLVLYLCIYTTTTIHVFISVHDLKFWHCDTMRDGDCTGKKKKIYIQQNEYDERESGIRMYTTSSIYVYTFLPLSNCGMVEMMV